MVTNKRTPAVNPIKTPLVNQLIQNFIKEKETQENKIKKAQLMIEKVEEAQEYNRIELEELLAVTLDIEHKFYYNDVAEYIKICALNKNAFIKLLKKIYNIDYNYKVQKNKNSSYTIIIYINETFKG